jgi:hypothetical protein
LQKLLKFAFSVKSMTKAAFPMAVKNNVQHGPAAWQQAASSRIQIEARRGL